MCVLLSAHTRPFLCDLGAAFAAINGRWRGINGCDCALEMGSGCGDSLK
jgi:hypothetical protein